VAEDIAVPMHDAALPRRLGEDCPGLQLGNISDGRSCLWKNLSGTNPKIELLVPHHHHGSPSATQATRILFCVEALVVHA
jgi:hypothetical protein